MTDAKISNVPMDPGYVRGRKDNDEGLLLTNTKYRQLVGSLLYAPCKCVYSVHCTRPDIASSISILSQHVSKPHQADWNELKRVLRYLKGTINLTLALRGVNHTGDSIYGYADASHAECRIDRKSQSGYIIFVNGGVTS